MGKIKEHVEYFYKQLYSEPAVDRPKITQLNLRSISSKTASRLEKEFTKAKNLQALGDLATEKTLGLDGFPIRFDQVCWSFMKADILAIFWDFYARVS